ncbi:MAG: hypothetical protein WA830_10800 [Candidatus Sulfotelmatobacter sp.]
MESPVLPLVTRERLMSTLPAQCRAAWAQIVVEINGVKRFAMPLLGCMQKISFAGPAAQPVAK